MEIPEAKLLEVQSENSTVSDDLYSHLLILDCCFFIKSNVSVAVYLETLEQFMLPSAEKLSGEADFI